MMEYLNNVSHVDNNENIALDANTKLNDWIEANFVMKKWCNRCCLWIELEDCLRNGTNVETVNLPSAILFEGYRH